MKREYETNENNEINEKKSLESGVRSLESAVWDP